MADSLQQIAVLVVKPRVGCTQRNQMREKVGSRVGQAPAHVRTPVVAHQRQLHGEVARAQGVTLRGALSTEVSGQHCSLLLAARLFSTQKVHLLLPTLSQQALRDYLKVHQQVVLVVCQPTLRGMCAQRGAKKVTCD